MLITPLYAGLIGLLYITLAINVIRIRRASKISLGYGDNKLLERRIRAHGNCAEYAPLALLLIAFVEISGGSNLFVHALGAALVIGRVLHGWSLSSLTPQFAGRVCGMVVTLTVIGLSALACIYMAI